MEDERNVDTSQLLTTITTKKCIFLMEIPTFLGISLNHDLHFAYCVDMQFVYGI